VRKEAIPQWAEGLYYNKGLFSEVLVYYDDEALLFREQGQGRRRGALHLRDARDPDGGDRRGTRRQRHTKNERAPRSSSRARLPRTHQYTHEERVPSRRQRPHERKHTEVIYLLIVTYTVHHPHQPTRPPRKNVSKGACVIGSNGAP
jgi:hypothetical protein